MKSLKKVYRGFSRLFYPNICPGCHRSMMDWERDLCNICWKKIPYLELQKGKNTLLQNRLAGRVHLHQGYAMMRFYQGGISQKILHAIKYQGKQKLAVNVGEKFGQRLEGILQITAESVLVPVPLHPLKRQMRGFNQSEKIAEGLARSLDISACHDGLDRVKFHTSQTKKGKEARWEQIKDDFVLKNEKIKHRDIILVDDVCTSGATIEACANALKEGDVKSISLLTLAVAGDHYQ